MAAELSQVLGDEGIITLWSDKQKISAHKCILSAASEFFKKLLGELPPMATMVVFTDIKFVDLEAIVKYIYTSKCTQEDRERASFFAAAKKLQITIKDLDSPVVQYVRTSTDEADSVKSPPERLIQKNRVVPTKKKIAQAQSSLSVEVPVSKAGSVKSRPKPIVQEDRVLPTKNIPKVNVKSEISLQSRLNTLLNELNINNADATATELQRMADAETLAYATLVMNTIVKWAIKNVNRTTAYGRLCKRLMGCDGESAGDNLFRLAFKPIGESLCDELVNCRAHNERRVRCLGIVRFLSILFMYRVLSSRIIVYNASMLLLTPNNDQLDIFYECMAIVGKRLEQDNQSFCDMGKLFDELRSIVADGKCADIAPDTKKRLFMLAACRRNRWTITVELILGDYGPILRKPSANTK